MLSFSLKKKIGKTNSYLFSKNDYPFHFVFKNCFPKTISKQY